MAPEQITECSPGGWLVLLQVEVIHGTRQLSWLAESPLGGRVEASTGEELLGKLWELERDNEPLAKT